MKKPKEVKLEYNNFVINIDKYLLQVKDFLKINEITFSFKEIDDFKEFYEKNYKYPQKINLEYDELVFMFYAYVGEAFMYRHGGNWELSKLKRDEAFGTPIINNWGEKNTPHVTISPWVWKTLIEMGKFRGKLSDAIKN